MLTRSGLLPAIIASTITLEEAGEATLEFIKSFVPTQRSTPLCGNSIGMDRRFLDAYPSSTALDLDGAPVFLASSAFTLRYEQERWPAVTFSDVKDYQRAAA